AGDQIYNSSYNVMQFCNGTNWVNMGGVASSVSAAGTTGAVQFNTSNALDADANYLIWDKTNHRLGIGSTSPATALDVVGAVSASTILTAARVAVTGSTIATNGIYLPASNTIGISANSIDAVRFNTASSGVNYFSLTPSATGSAITLAAAGSDTNIGLDIN